MYAVNYESSKILKFYNLTFVELIYQKMNAVNCESSQILKFYNLAFVELIYQTMYTELWVFEICFRYQTMYFLIDQTIKSHLLKCAPSFYFHVVADSSDDVREKLVFILHICRKRTMSSRPSLHIKREGSQVEQLLKQRPRC